MNDVDGRDVQEEGNGKESEEEEDGQKDVGGKPRLI